MKKLNLFLFFPALLNASFIFISSYLFAHELIPNVVDIEVGKERIDIKFTTNLEAYISGVDFSIVDNASEHDNSAYYEKLRGLKKTELSAIFMTSWEDFKSSFFIYTDDGKLLNEFILSSVETEDIDNLEMPRLSTVHFFVISKKMRPFTFQALKKHGDIILRQGGLENGAAQYLLSGEKSVLIPNNLEAQTSWTNTFADYIPVGFTHIIPKGLDHILFVLGVLFLTSKIYPLVFQISIFTLAHTITLGLSSAGFINLSAEIIEPLIALSITYIAAENIFKARLTKYRSFTIFAFGLLHGLGFASVLANFGLPQDYFLWALIGFNIGVELGQLVLLFAGYLILAYTFKTNVLYRTFVTIPGSLFIGLFGLWWFFERTFFG